MKTETITPITNLQAAQIARLSYEAGDEKHTIQEATDRIRDRLVFGLDKMDFEVIRNGAESALILSDEYNFIICATGTNDDDDWKGNAGALQRRLGNWPGKVHSGFDAGADAILLGVSDALAGIDNRVLTLMGHSRGGAIATLMAMKLHDRNIRVSKVITFGSPRCLNREAAPFYDFNYVRFANQGDSVPHGPTVWRYIHVGRQQYLLADGTISSFSLWDLVVQGSKILVELIWKRKAGYTLEAHNMKTYIKRLKETQKKYEA